jgi:hypothetical protein
VGITVSRKGGKSSGQCLLSPHDPFPPHYWEFNVTNSEPGINSLIGCDDRLKHMKFIVPLMLAHVIPAMIFVMQDTSVSSSFHSQSCWLFYLFIITGMTGFCLMSHSFVKRAGVSTAAGEVPTGFFPICYKCNALMYPRTFHCPKCGCCFQHHFGHVDILDSCLCRQTYVLAISGLGLSILYYGFVIGESFRVLFQFDSFLNYLMGKFLLFVILPPVLYVFIQEVIFFFQLSYLILTNGIILETRHKFGFEYFVMQDPGRNPYNMGIIENIREFLLLGIVVFWPNITPGPVTDAYCEDMQRYRGVDLKPCMVPSTN